MDTDRNLLFGAMTVNADLVDDGQLTQACTAWAAGEAETLADVMVDRGLITQGDRAEIERMVERKLKKHGGDVAGTLAATIDGPTRQALTQVADEAIQKTMSMAPRPGRARRPLGNQRQPDDHGAVHPHPPARHRRHRPSLARARRQFRPRGRAEGDPPRARGERRRLVPLPRGGADHRPARAPRDRAGLRARRRRRRAASVLHDALRQGPDPQRGRPRLPQGAGRGEGHAARPGGPAQRLRRRLQRRGLRATRAG